VESWKPPSRWLLTGVADQVSPPSKVGFSQDILGFVELLLLKSLVITWQQSWVWGKEVRWVITWKPACMWLITEGRGRRLWEPSQKVRLSQVICGFVQLPLQS